MFYINWYNEYMIVINFVWLWTLCREVAKGIYSLNCKCLIFVCFECAEESFGKKFSEHLY